MQPPPRNRVVRLARISGFGSSSGDSTTLLPPQPTASKPASRREAGVSATRRKIPEIMASRRCYARRDDRMEPRRGAQAGRIMMRRMVLAAFAGAALVISGTANAQQGVDFSKVEVKVTDLGNKTYRLEGA